MRRSFAHALAALALGAAAWLAAPQPAAFAQEAERAAPEGGASPSSPSPSPAPVPPAPAPAPGSAEAPAAAAPAAARAPRRGAPRGLWVLCEGAQRVLERADHLPGLLSDAKALGVTDLFVQVYRGGRAWFDSSLADTGPWHRTWRSPDPAGGDALATLIERARAEGLRVHAWVNVLSLSTNAEAPLLRELGADAVLTDQWGRSILDYPGYDVPEAERRSYRIGTPAIYLDPAAPGVAERLAATFEELLRRYPGLSGLHLDYIRYPDVLPYLPGTRFGVGLSFGYGAATRARFQAETGLEAPFATERLGNAARFDEWRRAKLSALVATIAERARSARPGAEISAAVYPDVERAYLGLYQDWRGWLEAGSLDFAVPMLYSKDARLFGYQVDELAGLPEAERIWIGLGSWLFASDPARAVEQTRRVLGRSGVGVAFFSWDSIHEEPALRDALATTAPTGASPSEPAPSPAGEPAAAPPGEAAPPASGAAPSEPAPPASGAAPSEPETPASGAPPIEPTPSPPGAP